MLETGIKGRAETVVTDKNTAITAGSGNLPVFATPFMTALMEEAAWKAVAPYLEEGQGTVGTSLSITHDAATPVGMKVWAECQLIEIDKRRLVFAVEAFDEAGSIGKGKHERFIIQNEKFLARTNSKLEKE